MAVDFSSRLDQIEALFVGYFGRAGDTAGANYWVGQLIDGYGYAQAANSYSVQVEARSNYPYLAAPQSSDVGSFVDAIYQNLFNHAPDAAGRAYWSGVLNARSGDPQAVGGFVLDVISGAQGVDAATLVNKVTAAHYYTTEIANNGVLFTPESARAAIAGVTYDEGTLVASGAIVNAFVRSSPGSVTLHDEDLQASGAAPFLPAFSGSGVSAFGNIRALNYWMHDASATNPDTPSVIPVFTTESPSAAAAAGLNYPGPTALMPATSWVLERFDGRAFTLASMDLESLQKAGQDLILTATSAGGDVRVRTLRLDSDPGWQHITFAAELQDIRRVVFDYSAGGKYYFDNITVATGAAAGLPSEDVAEAAVGLVGLSAPVEPLSMS